MQISLKVMETCVENDNGYFCILAGMDNIIISSGNKVFKGEPMQEFQKSLRINFILN